MEKAREHILSMESERPVDQDRHLEAALQQLYFAGQVDPDGRQRYLQMAMELLHEKMEQLRDEPRAKRADKEKRMEYYLKLKSELTNG
jgi:hypothetical protein